ncbi:hypothetical protein [Rhodococcus opacus]|uniref:hypothetical protein n=1 Tax=Rhodococcus opacus TaxID=37919 RepID=UPI00155A68E9|nr:hypothetical protein [Rhodococcus opacus]
MEITTLKLVTSRVVIRWREDGMSCVAREEDLPRLEARPDNIGSIWHPPFTDRQVIGFEEAPPGELDRPSWWAIYGYANPDVQVTVTVDDQPAPIVHRLGSVWACEWVSLPTRAHVHRSDQDTPDVIRFIRPEFLPPAPYPEHAR